MFEALKKIVNEVYFRLLTQTVNGDREMNNKFYELPYEKQLSIINAGLEVFSTFDYKKASTEEIAYKAGISKGLLFHYFDNKASFFEYLYLYAREKLKEDLNSSCHDGKGDFFQILEDMAEAKCKLLQDYPYMLNFMMMTTYSKDETVQKVLETIIEPVSGKNILKQISRAYGEFDIEPIQADIMELLAYALEGYLYRLLKTDSKVQLEAVMSSYTKWISLLKNVSYKGGEER